MPIDALRQISGDERTNERAEVDTHVEQGESGVAARVSLPIERADERAYVRLQQAGANDDEAQACVEERKRLEREREVARSDDDPADEHASILAEHAVRHETAEDRGPPDAARVRPVDRRRVRIREAQSARAGWRGHVQNEERTHPVVAETLPHLREEERRESAWVAEEAPIQRHYGVGHGLEHTTVGSRRSGVAPSLGGRSQSAATFLKVSTAV